MPLKIALNKINQYLINQKSVLLSVSGGLDSVVLLDIVNSEIKYANLDIHILHVNYNTNKNSDLAEDLCLRLAKEYNNKIKIYKVNISKGNFESKARDFRYEKLSSYAIKHNIKNIFTAHHRDDQIETLFMRYKNNSDWISMLGIREQLGLFQRPFINIKKNILLKYASQKKLKWVEDLTNADTSFLRNKVRHILLDEEKKNNINIEKDLLKISLLNFERYNKVSDRIKKYIKNNFPLNHSFYFISNEVSSMFSKDELKLFYQYFIKIIFHESVNSTRDHWKNLHDFLIKAKTGSKFYLNKNFIIYMDRQKHFLMTRIYYKKLNSLSSVNKKQISSFPFKWTDDSIIVKNSHGPYNVIISKDIFQKGIFVRHWRAGDKCFMKKSKKFVKLKKIFINNKINFIKKNNIPIFIDGNDNIISIPTLFNKCDKHSNSVKIFWDNKYD